MPVRVEITPMSGYLLVRQTGELDMAGAVTMQRDIDAAMSRHECRRVMFDNRETMAVREEVRQFMHQFVTTPGRFERLAMVFHSERLIASLRMEALAKRLPLRAFDSIGAAEVWLRAR